MGFSGSEEESSCPAVQDFPFYQCVLPIIETERERETETERTEHFLNSISCQISKCHREGE